MTKHPVLVEITPIPVRPVFAEERNRYRSSLPLTYIFQVGQEFNQELNGIRSFLEVVSKQIFDT